MRSSTYRIDYYRFLFGVILCVLLGVLIVTSAPAHSNAQNLLTPIPSSTSTAATPFIVDAAKGWQDTRISFTSGDHLLITYLSGQWRTNSQENYYGPDGGSSYICTSQCVEPLSSYPKGGLVGRIGSSPAFAVGRRYEGMVQQNGTLQVRINDAGIDDNDGSVAIQISGGVLLPPLTDGNLADLSNAGRAMVLLNVSPGKSLVVVEQLLRLAFVVEVYSVSGAYDLVVILKPTTEWTVPIIAGWLEAQPFVLQVQLLPISQDLLKR